MKITIVVTLACLSLFVSGASAAKGRQRPNKASDIVLGKHLSSGRAKTTDSEGEVFLRITSHMKDQNTTSGGNVQFKCKVDGRPKNNIEYTWYKEDSLIDPVFDRRVSVATRQWGSRLRIKDLYTLDSGLYRCEASNGLRRVHTTAHLIVSFERPPPPLEHEKPIIKFPSGKCEKYRGVACRDFLEGRNIYVDAFQDQVEMETQIRIALHHISDQRFVSGQCQKFAVPAFCFFVFPPCHENGKGDIKRRGRLCREDCQLLKRDICHKEYLQRDKNPFLSELFNATNCTLLPSAEDSECTRVGLLPADGDQTCYHGSGDGYRGTAHVTESGLPCKEWPSSMHEKHSELSGGHNFCRNPGQVMDQPWCFVDERRTRRAICGVEKCEIKSKSTSNLTIIVAFVVCAAIVVVAVVLAIFLGRRFCKKKHRRFGTGSLGATEILQVQMPLMTSQKSLVPHVQPTSIRLLSEIGNGEYGKIYKGIIVDDPRFTSKQSFAMKVLKDNFATSQVDQFKCEMKLLSELKHSKVACLKAVVLQPSFYCLVLDYTDQTDLYEHLVLNTPNSDVTKHVTANGHASASISTADFFKMACQIASGMEYLSSHNYIHRDLAARNVLVSANMDLKICNLGVVRDSYLSSYYRSPQGRLWPVRWMAPESLQSWQFSDKSAVWSFGVLLWEMFSYGLQPYCGYSNHEVLDMISRRQLLTCPDQCPAKMYSLMHECWAPQPQVRPCFKVLHTKLQTYSEICEEPLIVKSVELRRIPKVSISSPSPPPEYTTHPNSYAPSCSDNATASERSFASSDAGIKKKISSQEEKSKSSSSSDSVAKQPPSEESLVDSQES